MAGKRGIFLLLIIPALAACSSPLGVGNAGGSSGGSIVNSLVYEEGLDVTLRVASRTYKAGDRFEREHLRVVFTTYRGETMDVLYECDIFIEDPAMPGAVELGANGYTFTTSGVKGIRVEYGDFVKRITVTVGAAIPPPQSDQGQTGIIIIWAE